MVFYKKEIIILCILLIEVYRVKARNYYCEAINDKTLCNNLASTGCSWCNEKWGCMTVKDGDKTVYECPTECVSDECYSPQNITTPIFYNYYYLQSSNNKVLSLVKETNKKNKENYYTCSENCLKAIVSDWKMFKLVDNAQNAGIASTKQTDVSAHDDDEGSGHGTLKAAIIVVLVLFLISVVLSVMLIYKRKVMKGNKYPNVGAKNRSNSGHSQASQKTNNSQMAMVNPQQNNGSRNVNINPIYSQNNLSQIMGDRPVNELSFRNDIGHMDNNSSFVIPGHNNLSGISPLPYGSRDISERDLSMASFTSDDNIRINKSIPILPPSVNEYSRNLNNNTRSNSNPIQSKYNHPPAQLQTHSQSQPLPMYPNNNNKINMNSSMSSLPPLPNLGVPSSTNYVPPNQLPNSFYSHSNHSHHSHQGMGQGAPVNNQRSNRNQIMINSSAPNTSINNSFSAPMAAIPNHPNPNNSYVVNINCVQGQMNMNQNKKPVCIKLPPRNSSFGNTQPTVIDQSARRDSVNDYGNGPVAEENTTYYPQSSNPLPPPPLPSSQNYGYGNGGYDSSFISREGDRSMMSSSSHTKAYNQSFASSVHSKSSAKPKKIISHSRRSVSLAATNNGATTTTIPSSSKQQPQSSHPQNKSALEIIPETNNSSNPDPSNEEGLDQENENGNISQLNAIEPTKPTPINTSDSQKVNDPTTQDNDNEDMENVPRSYGDIQFMSSPNSLEVEFDPKQKDTCVGEDNETLIVPVFNKIDIQKHDSKDTGSSTLVSLTAALGEEAKEGMNQVKSLDLEKKEGEGDEVMKNNSNSSRIQQQQRRISRRSRGLSRSISDCVYNERRKSKISSLYQNTNNTYQSIPQISNNTTDNDPPTEDHSNIYDNENGNTSINNNESHPLPLSKQQPSPSLLPPQKDTVYNQNLILQNPLMKNSHDIVYMNKRYSSQQPQHFNHHHNSNYNYTNVYSQQQKPLPNKAYNGSLNSQSFSGLSTSNESFTNLNATKDLDLANMTCPQILLNNTSPYLQQAQQSHNSQSPSDYSQEYLSFSSNSNSSLDIQPPQQQQQQHNYQSDDTYSKTVNKNARRTRNAIHKNNPYFKIKRISYNSQLKRNELWLKLWNVDDKDIIEQDSLNIKRKKKNNIF